MDFKQLKLDISTNLKQLKTNLTKIKNLDQFNDLKTSSFGKNSFFVTLRNNFRSIDNQQKREYGLIFNDFRQELEELFASKENQMQALYHQEQLKSQAVDLDYDQYCFAVKPKHILNQMEIDLTNFLVQHNFKMNQHKIIDTNFYNFDLLNVGPDHPARKEHDTFYLDDNEDNHLPQKNILSTHCTNVSSRYLHELEKTNDLDEIRIASIGRVFRNDDNDSTHSFQFMQLDALVLAKYNVTCAHLKTFISNLLNHFFDQSLTLRFRTSYFPFTEPSFEVDIKCIFCTNSNTRCSVCANRGWIEVLGAGMIHENVISACKFDLKQKWKGFAFGVGLDRLAMIKYQIKDIRDLYTNDVKFLGQF